MSTNGQQIGETNFSAITALCLAAMTMVGIDGEFKEEELEKLRSLIHTDESAFLLAFNFYNDHPLDVCIKTVSARLNDDQKRVTYRVLYDLAQVDKDFAVSEQDLLNHYVAMFRLKRDYIDSVIGPVLSHYNLSVFGEPK